MIQIPILVLSLLLQDPQSVEGTQEPETAANPVSHVEAELQDPHSAVTKEDVGVVWERHMNEEVEDARVWHIPLIDPLVGEIDLPQFSPIRIGSLSIDLSPTKHVIWLLIAASLCAFVLIWTARRNHARHPTRAPSGLANAIEAFVIYLRDEVVMRSVGPGGERYVPFILTIFFFILFTNLLGLVPFGATATGNISVTAALALLSLVAIEVGGFLHLGPRGYLRTIVFVPHGVNIVWQIIITPLMSVIELVSKFARIFALAIRLFANMIAGHFVILAMVGLIFLAGAAASSAKYFVWPAPVAMTVAVMLLEIFVAFLQAYIFVMLTSVFIGLVRQPH